MMIAIQSASVSPKKSSEIEGFVMTPARTKVNQFVQVCQGMKMNLDLDNF